MKHLRVILLLVLLLIVFVVVLPSLRRAKAYSGPGVRGQLSHLQMVKLRWEREHPSGTEWPTREDLLPYLTNGTPFRTFEEAFRPRWGEVYIINRTGAPAFAYFPKGGAGVHEGELLQLSSNELQEIYQP